MSAKAKRALTVALFSSTAAVSAYAADINVSADRLINAEKDLPLLA